LIAIVFVLESRPELLSASRFFVRNLYPVAGSDISYSSELFLNPDP
jgi:hypothetical protein